MITPREVLVILDGADARDKTDLRIKQAIAYATAQLVAVAVNNPKKLPSFDKMFPDKSARKKVQDPEDIWSAMSAWAASEGLAKSIRDRD